MDKLDSQYKKRPLKDDRENLKGGGQ
jgi:hypothetical protein